MEEEWNDPNAENSSDLSNGEWSDTFSYGTIKGVALCSDTNGAGGPGNATTGPYCWCRATGYKPTGSDVVYSPEPSLSWELYGNFDVDNRCNSYCASACALEIQESADFRSRLFGQSN